MDTLDHLQSVAAPRYVVRDEIAHGGMATVYRAHDRDTGDTVAIKVLDPEVAAVLGAERFTREIEIAARLDHENILPLIESGQGGTLLYYVMPYVEGGSLRERMDAQGPLPVEDTLRIIRAVAGGLDHAHAQGIIHRDVKPENILLSETGVFITDFGIAHMLLGVDEDRLTATGHTVGTPPYTSPEQAEGKAVIDARTDVYSLGCVAYEMLAGEPPFVGPDARSVIVRHISVPATRLDVLRPSLPEPVVAGVAKALAKTPVDRFSTASEFADALEAPEPVLSRAEVRRRSRRRRWTAGAGLTATLAGFILWSFIGPRVSGLDPNKVVVFPLATATTSLDPATGWDVALAIGAALEHTAPLKWIDGWTWLGEEERRDPGRVTAELARRLSIERGAAYYVGGAVRENADSIAVVVRLHDVAGDSLVVQETAPGVRSSATLGGLGLDAVRRVLPRLVDPDRVVDLTPLSDRDAGALALWLQGEREYRQSRFDRALDLYERAVAEDSMLAFAAIKGAQAASWESRFGDASRLIDHALSLEPLLPAKYRAFAKGLAGYLGGDAEAAVAGYRTALDVDDEWSEASMALGDTYYHLLPPDATPPDSMARFWFERAWGADSTFGPPLFHLTELALRRGDTEAASQLMSEWERFDPDTILFHQVHYSRECLVQGHDRFSWRDHLPDNARAVLQAGSSLAGGASQVGCARAALAAVFNGDLDRNLRWVALMGLQGLATAQGRYVEADSLIRTGLATGISAAQTLYIYAVHAGAPFAEQSDTTEAIMRRAFGDLYASTFPRWRWLAGTWLARSGDTARVTLVTADMEWQAEEAEDRRARLLARALEAHRLVALADTTGAIDLLLSLVPNGQRNEIAFQESDALAPERILLAELLLARGDFEGAHRVATLLDHQAPLIYVQFVAKSLAIRVRAAEAMSAAALAQTSSNRLVALGWTDPEQLLHPPR